MKVTFRKVTESKIPKEPKPNEKDLNRKTSKGTFTNDLLETPKKKVANKSQDLIPKTLRSQKNAKQVVERNDFAPQGPDGFDEPLEDTDRQAQLDAMNQTTNPVAENRIVILSFEAFLNEADDFKSQFAPTNIDGGSEMPPDEREDDSDMPVAEEPAENDDNNEEDDDSKDNDWYMSDNGSEGDEPAQPGAPEDISGDADYATQSQLTSINDQLSGMLKDYRGGRLNVQQYKDKASPLLKQRKDLQAKMDQIFNMSLSGEDETGVGTPDGNPRF